ncbi:hypothetical protein FH972_001274 [Carpinus fangiana]|uniref:Pentatricopeptide repeat-containing protein n=1 Tax=Carpinus fangiana TaxID=176857 RepID=A0A5N6QB91_9ROSI|nr:hypothetical protein FH972_001274 [Carpinus fangiana]
MKLLHLKQLQHLNSNSRRAHKDQPPPPTPLPLKPPPHSNPPHLHGPPHKPTSPILSLSILVDSLTSQPYMSLPMSLLTHLKHNLAAHSHLTPITTMLIASYFKKHKPKEALKVFNWMVRPGSPCVLDEKVCGILVYGFCKQGIVLEALKVLRAMVGVNLVPGRDLGTCEFGVTFGTSACAPPSSCFRVYLSLSLSISLYLKGCAKTFLANRSFVEILATYNCFGYEEWDTLVLRST